MIQLALLVSVAALLWFARRVLRDAEERIARLASALVEFRTQEKHPAPEWVLAANEIVAEAEFLWGLVRKDGPRAARLGALAGAAGVAWAVSSRSGFDAIVLSLAGVVGGLVGWAYIAHRLGRNERRLRGLREEIREATSNVSGKMRARVDRSGSRRYPRELD